jgi:hypothetical protein
MPDVQMMTNASGGSAPVTQAGWVAQILRELGRSQTSGFVLDALQWTLLGALLGLLLSIGGCVFLSRLGWYDVRFRFAGGVRWTMFVLIVTISAILFGLAGFWSGAIKGSERVLSRSQLGTDVFPKIAEAIADAMAWIQIHAPAATTTTNSSELTVKLEQFRDEKWELDAAQFLVQLETFRSETIGDLVAKLEQSTLERTPSLKGGLGEKLLHQLLTGLARLVVEKKVGSELKNWGADRIYFAIQNQLAAEAARSGNPQTIGRAEISAFIVREGIVPGIMKPIRTTARAQQVPLVLLTLVIILAPALCIRLVKSRLANRAPKPPTI